jgi:chromosome segregation ATPase
MTIHKRHPVKDELKRLVDRVETLSTHVLNIEDMMEKLVTKINRIDRREVKMAGELDALEAAVAREAEVTTSAISLIKGIAAQLADIQNDPVKIAALVDSLNASADALANAVVENTPAV